MATESPIRIIEGGDRWPVLKKSTRYRSPSGKMSIEDLGLLLQDQRFLRSPEKDTTTPCRSESAPPSMDGSMAALGNIFSFKRSAARNSDSATLLAANLEVEDHPRADVSLRLPIHAEESEDDQSSERSCSLSAEKVTAAFGCTWLNPKQEECCQSREGSVVFDTNTDISRAANMHCSDEISRVSSLDISRVSSLDGARDFAASWHSGIIDKDFNISSGDEDVARGDVATNSHQNNMNVGPPPVAGSYPQFVYPSIGNAYGFSTPNAQPVLHASGYTPPLYAANAAVAFMASSSGYYPNIGYTSQQYNMAGYSPNSVVIPSYHLPGYPPHQPYALSGGTSFLTSGAPPNVHPQNFPGFYCQAPTNGIPMNPAFGMGYFRPDSYRHFGHQDGAGVNQMNSSFQKKSPETGGFSNDNKSQHAPVMNFKRRGSQSSYYTTGSSRNDGSLKQIPSSFTKPFSGGRYNNASFSHSSEGVMQFRSNEQRQSWDGLNSYSFLEELKSGKGQRFELSDIIGHIIEFSVDQHGSRFIQQKLEVCSVEEKESVLNEVIPHASKLMTDVFGNYVIQKLFEYGSPDQRKRLTNQLEGQILNLSLQMYGCRVIQKALEAIDLEQKTRLARELEGHILRCVRDQNGNHVIQKCIESIPTDNIHFIISAFRGQVASLSMHPYGCRVIQRVLEHCSDDKQTQFIVDEILESVSSLARDQYGNYVTQHVLERGKAEERRDIVVKLSGSILQLSQHKFASNVIEKCVEYGDTAARGLVMKEIVSDENLLVMMKDQFANYVVQKVVEKSCGDEKEALLGMIRNHLTTLKKYTYGKHIVARFERICVEENRSR